MQIEAEVGLSAVHSSDLQVTPGEKKYLLLLFRSPRSGIMLERTAQMQPHLTISWKRLLNHSCQRKDRHSGNEERLLAKQVRRRDKRVISI